MMAVADILITPAAVYLAPYGEAQPSINTVFYGVAWAGNWVNMGYTMEKVSLMRKVTDYELEVEQITLPVSRLLTKEEYTIETTLAEQTGANMSKMLGGTLTTVAAGTNIRASETVTAGGNPAFTLYTVGFEGFYIGANSVKLPVRVFLYRCTVTLGGALEFTKNKGAGIPVQFKALADTTLTANNQVIKWQKVTAKGTTDAEV
jgi:hypothetical protein